MAYKQNGALNQHMKDTQIVVHLSSSSQRIVSDDFQMINVTRTVVISC